jgi:hypothetical protein
MLKDEFIQEIQDEITVGCSLPFSVPKKEIERIIKYGEKWIYKKYEDAVEERYYTIKVSQLNDANFKAYRTIQLPECIYSVNTLTQINQGFGSSNPFSNMADFSLEKALFKNINDLSNSTEALMEYVVYESFIDLSQHMLTHPVSYNYNRITRDLVILGETPTSDLVLQVYNKVPLEDLMEDEIFYRYCVAKAKTQLARILGAFDFKLPGGVSINYDTYKEEGVNELEKLEEELKSDEGMDWFFTTGGR